MHHVIYFIIFINDLTRYGYVYFISHKSKNLDYFIKFMNIVENQLDMNIEALRTYKVREYLYD